MPRKAKLVIDAMIAAGITSLLLAVIQFRCEWPLSYLLFTILSMIGGTRKFRLPGITGAYSLGFCFILIGIFNFSSSEAILIAAQSGWAQCLYRPAKTPSVRSVLFSVSGIVLSTAAAGWSYHATLSAVPAGSYLAALLAASVYWAMNTGLVTIALSLNGEGDLKAIWDRWFVWTLPYYIAGAAVAIAVGPVIRQGHWIVPVLLLPPIAVVYACGRLWLRIRTH